MPNTNQAPSAPSGEYPVNLSVDFPKRPLDKLSTFFRFFTAIPIWIVLGLLLSGGGGVQVSIVGFVVLPVMLMILFRKKYPKWWYDWNVQLANFSFRVAVYVCLLNDEYPATDQEQSVHIRLPYPDASKDLNRWLPLVKWLLVIPHYIVLAVLSLAALVIVCIAWVAILINGTYPKELFQIVAGVMRWHLRVFAYAFLLTTDQYPPFSLNA